MSLRIFSAIYRKDGVEKEISLTEMTREIYESSYKGYLYCPNPDCTARIVFAAGKERSTYFRTWRIKVNNDGELIDQHIQNCPFYVEHEPEERAIARNDPNTYYRLSANHKRDVLRRAFDREFNADKIKKRNKTEEGDSKKRASSRRRMDYTLQPRGNAGLGIDGATEGGDREPSVYRKQIDEISDLDSNSVQCVSGYVDDLILNKDYPFFTFSTKNDKNARILISEAFAVNNPAQFQNIKIYKDYIDYCTRNGSKPFVCCIGKIIKDEYGISVIPEEYVDIDLDRKGYYRILSEVNSLYSI